MGPGSGPRYVLESTVLPVDHRKLAGMGKAAARTINPKPISPRTALLISADIYRMIERRAIANHTSFLAGRGSFKYADAVVIGEPGATV
jgi:hypothetical protein